MAASSRAHAKEESSSQTPSCPFLLVSVVMRA